jgi:uncharacterized protein YbjT (DUF2867 family)
MRVAVFGASGLVGSALVPGLAVENEVVALSRRSRPDTADARFVVADATHPSSLDVLEGSTSSRRVPFALTPFDDAVREALGS